MGGFVPAAAIGGITSDDLRVFVREAIEETAARGDAVIVAHAASHALGGRQEALRVLVTASPETRARRIAEGERLDEPKAARAIDDADAARADYLKRFHGVREELPTQYDLVLNTDQLSFDETAALISAAAAS
jgi:cytidylate kinase